MLGRLFVVAACSGTGKTSLVNEVIVQLKDSYAISRLVTYTTKMPRVNEVHGRDYFFLSEYEFELKIKEGFFLEWSREYGNYYGSPASVMQGLGLGESYIVITDIVGAQSLSNLIKEAIVIWIHVEGIEELKKRLFSRNTEDFKQINKRLLIAHEELTKKASLDIFTYTVNNENFQNALQELRSIVESELKKSLVSSKKSA